MGYQIYQIYYFFTTVLKDTLSSFHLIYGLAVGISPVFYFLLLYPQTKGVKQKCLLYISSIGSESQLFAI